MDWSNLLSAVLGGVIGSAGVLVSTFITIRRDRDQDAERARIAAEDAAAQARREHALRVSGELAYKLVEFYEDLRLLLSPRHEAETTLEIGRLRGSATALRHAITVDGPLLDGSLETKMRVARTKIKLVIDRDTTYASAADLEGLLAVVKAAGDDLRELRRRAYDRDLPGSHLGE